MDDKVTYFGEADYRNKHIKFGIKASDRTRHVYAIGKTGMGKSTLLENMAIQDIQSGNGIAFVDPHGSTAEKLLRYVPEDRIDDVLYFAPFDMAHPVGFNIMEDVGEDKRHFVGDGLMSVFKRIWEDAWSARMEYILKNTIMALLEYPDSTLLGINRMYTEKFYRKKVVENITDIAVKQFWTQEYTTYTDRYVQEATPAIQNKVGQFVANPLVRNIIGQPKSTFDLRKMMDEKKIIIMNLSKGLVGEQNVNLLGSMLVTKLYLAAMSRQNLPPEEREKLPNFYLYVDEFQSFANESFAGILSEARKYKLNLTIAHQYIEQMSEEVRAAVFGNVGTMISFRVGSYDAEVLEKEFAPNFTAQDLVNLGRFQTYLKLMIDGVSSVPFSAMTLPGIPEPEHVYVDQVLARSREQFGRKRLDVEAGIVEWQNKERREEEAEREQEKRERLAKKGIFIDDKSGSSGERERKPFSRERSQDSRPGSQARRPQSQTNSSSGQPRQERFQSRNQTNRSQAFSESKQASAPVESEVKSEEAPNNALAESLKKAMAEREAKVNEAKPASPEVSRPTPLAPEVAPKVPEKKSFKRGSAKKDPQPENVNQLRAALAGLGVAAKPEATLTTPALEKTAGARYSATNDVPARTSSRAPESETSKEVSTEELKNILAVDEDALSGAD